MATYDYDLGVIGGGAAGLTVASGASQLGARTLLIEKEPSLGGDCLHFGCVPSKTLIHSARLYHSLKSCSRFGLPEVDMKEVDFSRIAERIRSVIAVIQEHDSVERFCRLGVEVRFGAPRFVDEHQIELGSKRISARSWVIATGSSSALPHGAALQNIPYITNKEIFTLDRLPASLVVLGAGPIAIEMAQSFCRLGSRVTVIQRSGQILSKEDKDLADGVMEVMESEGVRFMLNTTVIGARTVGNKQELVLATQAGEKTIQAETVLVAQGRRPNIDGLGLTEIGVAHSARGITVDERMRTSHSHIYAPGDVNGNFQFTHAAGHEGGIVVTNAIFRLPRKVNSRWMPWCTYCDPELASIGMNEKRAKEAGISYTVWTEEFSANDRALAQGEGLGKLKMLLDEKEKPLGVQILGPSAGELLAEWVAILNSGMKLSSLAGAIHPYPTLSEINKRVAGSYLSPKIFSPTVRKGLKLIFQLKGSACNPSSKI
ncbi:MAG: FAD-dependent oxidoreductase [Proteobacteria bacterium]|nr:FAD-dependent oxidoreductase [Desulfocapsa sp.]MBU3944680.1 FAD-dependent oxidoreductase [Pseudomonadota bacterium]MCG2743644.1 FAD-dependent oxidoreductase [Desulfobacteraceae bacterium]MBU3982406.1 FAD-dependent oxidoreductase [Pseudomonadota bacterium]MBU4030327.1 FAD-dependent oxidoreductase [Pseudomonadota bacterium]